MDVLLAILGILLAFGLVARCEGGGSISQKSFDYYSRSQARCQCLARKVEKAIRACGLEDSSLKTMAEIFQGEHKNLLRVCDRWNDRRLEELHQLEYVLNALSRIGRGLYDITPWEAHALNMKGLHYPENLRFFWQRISSCPVEYRRDRVEPGRDYDNPWFLFWRERDAERSSPRPTGCLIANSRQ